METLYSIYPNVQDLLVTPPEELAPVLLTLAKGMVQNQMFHMESVNQVAVAAPHAISGHPRYSFQIQQQVDALLSRAWA